MGKGDSIAALPSVFPMILQRWWRALACHRDAPEQAEARTHHLNRLDKERREHEGEGAEEFDEDVQRWAGGIPEGGTDGLAAARRAPRGAPPAARRTPRAAEP